MTVLHVTNDGGRCPHSATLSRVMALPAVALALLAPRPVKAYLVSGVFSKPCHERITFEGRRRARARLPDEVPLPPQTADDRALLNDLPFEMPEMGDLANATLALGNRHVDLLGYDADNMDALAEITADPATQPDHCLRRPNDDWDTGDLEALAACRAVIRSKLEAAVLGLAVDGRVDPTIRVEEEVDLELRGAVRVPLPKLYFHLGEALHTFQDAFSHHYRTADHHRPIAVMNYVDQVEGTLEPTRDGPPHSTELDRCSSLDAFRAERLEIAKEASMGLMVAMLDTARSPAERLDAAEVVLDEYLTYEPGCDAANEWCDAPERHYQTARGCGCRSVGSEHPTRNWASIPLIVLGLVVRRARRLWSVIAALAVVMTARTAMAYSAEPAATHDAGLVEPTAPGAPPRAVSLYAAPLPVDASPITRERQPFPLGISAMGAFGIEHSAFAFSLGVRYRVIPNVLLGADAEYNPFLSFHTGKPRPGLLNAYATLVLRFPLNYQRVNLRTTVNFGTSTLLFDLVGAPKGTTGVFLGGNLLGIDIEMTRTLYLIVDPAYIAYPIPQVDATPFAYPQYRISVGVQWGA